MAIDFAPGLHGHFLEYVINRYIFGVTCDIDSIFQSSGAVHAINVNTDYQQNKIANRGHYSSFDVQMPNDTSYVVFIKHNPKLDFILLTNIYHRCHTDTVNILDFNVKEIEKLHLTMMATDAHTPKELRENWFTKLQERHFDMTEKYPTTTVPVFDFNFSSFFSLPEFLLELQRVAKFLNVTFKFDQSLSLLWQDFIDRNQGYYLYSQGQEILNAIYNKQTKSIPDNWMLHAYLNYEIAKTFDLYDGALYNDKYPSNTLEAHDIIIKHIQDFDKYF